MAYHQTLSRIAPTFGLTGPKMRGAMIAAGLLDGDRNRPTRAGHIIGGARYVERDTQEGLKRFPVWDKDRISAALPRLRTDPEGAPTMYRGRHAAANALQAAALELRDRLDDRKAPLVNRLASQETAEALRATTGRPHWSQWGRKVLSPMLEEARQAARGNPLAQKPLERIEGVLSWLVDPICADIDDVEALPFAFNALPSGGRQMRDYPESHSLLLSDHEIVLITSGYQFNEPGGEDDRALVHDLVVPLLRKFHPGRKTDDLANDANGIIRFSRRTTTHLLLATTADDGRMLATAHPATITGNRLTIRSDADAYVLRQADGSHAADGTKALHLRLGDVLELNAND